MKMPRSRYYKSCSVFACTHDTLVPIRQYGFPKNPELQKKWVKLVTRKKLNMKYATVCSRHFSDKQRQRNLKHELLNYTPRCYRDLKKDAVPDLFLPEFDKTVQNEDFEGDYRADDPDALEHQHDTDNEEPDEELEASPKTLASNALLQTTLPQYLPTLTVPETSNGSSSGLYPTLPKLAVSQISNFISSGKQQPFQSVVVPQTSTISSSVQQQPFLTLAVPQTSPLPSSVPQQPMLALAMPQNFSYPPTLPNQSLSQPDMTQASSFLPSIQQQSLLNLSNPQLLSSYLSLLKQQTLLSLPMSQISKSQNSAVVPKLVLPSGQQSMLGDPAATQPCLVVNPVPTLELPKELEFVQVKEEPEEFSPECPDSSKKKSALICPYSSSGSVIKEESLEVPIVPVSISNENGDVVSTICSPLRVSTDVGQQVSGSVDPRLFSEDERQRNHSGEEHLDFPTVEVKVEIKEDDGDVNLTSEHPFWDQPSSEAAEGARLGHQPGKHQPGAQRAYAAGPCATNQQDAASVQTNESGTPKSSSTDPGPPTVMNAIQDNYAVSQSTEPMLKKECHRCAKCNFTSNKKDLLKQHLVTAHSNQKCYKCDQCSYVSEHCNTLKKHVRAVHLGQKPFKCGLCGLEAITKKGLQAHHKSKHSDERPFKCNQCEYASVYSSHLKRHISAMHPGPYSEKCNHCTFVAESESSFRDHLVSVHPDQKRLECTKCDYITLQSNKLQKHFMAQHPTEEPYQCDRCEFGTAWSHLLKEHVVSQH